MLKYQLKKKLEEMEKFRSINHEIEEKLQRQKMEELEERRMLKKEMNDIYQNQIKVF